MWAQNKQKGFTIVELLIVIVVIAILATISIVAYNGIQDRALVAVVKSDLANFAKKIEHAKVDTSDGGYPTILTAAMGIKVTKSAYIDGRYNWYYCLTPDHTKYSVAVISTKGKGYYQSSVNGYEESPGTTDSTSNCTKISTTPSNSAATAASSSGYQWNSGTSTGTWQAWVN